MDPPSPTAEEGPSAQEGVIYHFPRGGEEGGKREGGKRDLN